MKNCPPSRKKNYQGIRPPSCGGGKGCDDCRKIYEDKQAAIPKERAVLVARTPDLCRQCGERPPRKTGTQLCGRCFHGRDDFRTRFVSRN